MHRAVTVAPGAPDDSGEAVEGFRRRPSWMWASTDVADFARWPRVHHARLPADRRAGFFGLDVYSLWESLHTVLGPLRRHDPDRVDAYLCFELYAEDPREYARATRLVPPGCARGAVAAGGPAARRGNAGAPTCRRSPPTGTTPSRTSTGPPR